MITNPTFAASAPPDAPIRPANPVTFRYESLGAWRGVACLGVLFFHSLGRLQPDEAIWPVLAPLREVAAFGWLGVHLFFVISGYCIAEKIMSLSRRGAGAVAFWKNRFLRILPTYWAAVGLALAINLATVPFNHARLADQFPASWFEAAAHVLLYEPYFGLPAYLLVAWTLTSEIGFYAVAGLSLALPRRRHTLAVAWVAGALLCLVPLAFPSLSGHPVAGLWPDFFAGMAAYQTIQAWHAGERMRGLPGILALVGLGLLHGFFPDSYGGRIHLFAPAIALLLVLLRPWDAWLTRTLPARGLMAAGVISYSLYLTHVPIVSRIVNLGMRWIPASSPAFLLLWLAAIAAALAAAGLFYRVVEHPVEVWRKRHAP